MQVLMYRKTFERLRGRLSAEVPGLTVVAVADDGRVDFATPQAAAGAVAPELAWASSELYEGGPVRDFMVCCLKSRSLRFLQSASAGFDHPVFGMLVDKGVELANSNENNIAVAEYAVGCVFDAFQGMPARRRAQHEGSWTRLVAREVQGSRVVLVGLGAIGRAVAARLGACGARLTAVRRHPAAARDGELAEASPVERVVGPAGLADAVEGADAVICCAAANPENQHLFDAAVFARMATHTVFVNVARGSLVDEPALIAALDRGAPGSAYLDVFATEPLPPDSPLWQHPRVTLSAHCAGASGGARARNDELFLANVRRLLAGDRPMGLVEPDVVRASIVP